MAYMERQLQLKRFNNKIGELGAVLRCHSQSLYIQGQVNLLNCTAKWTENDAQEWFQIPPFCCYTL